MIILGIAFVGIVCLLAVIYVTVTWDNYKVRREAPQQNGYIRMSDREHYDSAL